MNVYVTSSASFLGTFPIIHIKEQTFYVEQGKAFYIFILRKSYNKRWDSKCLPLWGRWRR
jgi:hypothetical protein